MSMHLDASTDYALRKADMLGYIGHSGNLGGLVYPLSTVFFPELANSFVPRQADIGLGIGASEPL